MQCKRNTLHTKNGQNIYLPQYLILKMSYASPEHMKICRIKVLKEIKIMQLNGLSQNYKLLGIIYYSGNGNSGHYWSVTCKEDQLRIHNDSRSGYLKRTTPREYGIDTILYEKCFPSF